MSSVGRASDLRSVARERVEGVEDTTYGDM